MLKKLIKSILRTQRLVLYKEPYLPVGTDLRVDIGRFLGTDPAIIFDVGANIGQTTKFFLERFENSEYFIFEPIHSTFNALTSNFKNAPNLHFYNYALGAKNEEKTIYLKDDPLTNSLLNTPIAGSPSQNVEVKTVDGFLENNSLKNIDLLKIDVEGYEMEVLKGAVSALKANKIKLVLLENNFEKTKSTTQTSFNEALSFMRENSFELIGIYDQTIRYVNGKMALKFANVLYINQEAIVH